MTKTQRNSKGQFSRLKPRKIAIWGYAEESRNLIYELDESYEVWGINMAHAFINDQLRAKPTNWFQLHPSNWNGSGKGATGYWGRPVEHLHFLENFEGTVWMQYPDEDVAKTIKNRKAFPLEAISETARDYLTSTFAYQFALIWYQHTQLDQPVEEIRIYGVNLSAAEEYAYQRPCAEYWIGRLEQAGIKVVIPKASSLLLGQSYARGADKTGEIHEHALERLRHWRERYYASWADTIVAQAAKGEISQWARYLSLLFDAMVKNENIDFPEETMQGMQHTLQEQLDKRMSNMKKLEQVGYSGLNGAGAMVKDNFHWLTLLGGMDTKMLTLNELRSPSSALWDPNWEVPDPKPI